MRDATDIDLINRRTWATGQVLRQYRNFEGFTDPGERAALEWLRAECKDQPILDLGVGCGRTANLLRAISQDYIGVDYTRELLDVAIRKLPGVRFKYMDARDLSAFADESFFLVNFSFNAIDAVDYEDRNAILREVYRVMRPGGLFLFSAHNKQGPGTREDWRLMLPTVTRNPLKLGWRTAKKLTELPRALSNYLRFRGLQQDRGDYAISNAAAHNFGLVLLYSTLGAQKRQLADAGFQVEVVFDSEKGCPVSESDPLTGIWWFHYIARKP